MLVDSRGPLISLGINLINLSRPLSKIPGEKWLKVENSHLKDFVYCLAYRHLHNSSIIEPISKIPLPTSWQVKLCHTGLGIWANISVAKKSIGLQLFNNLDNEIPYLLPNQMYCLGSFSSDYSLPCYKFTLYNTAIDRLSKRYHTVR